MSSPRVAGLLLVFVVIAFNALFAWLAARFDYPYILRRPTSEVLGRFRLGGSRLILVWWAFALLALLIAPLAVLLAHALGEADETVLAVGSTIGVLAGIVQFLGLVRWPFLVPHLARIAADPDAGAARQEAVDVVFQSLNRYLGVAIGEHAGYLLTGTWSLFIGIAMLQDSTTVPGWIGFPGLVIGPVMMLCSLEFVGRFEPSGWKLAGALTPIAYIAWSIWLAATGVALIVSSA
jgi:uncharacterized protein DUF4386